MRKKLALLFILIVSLSFAGVTNALCESEPKELVWNFDSSSEGSRVANFQHYRVEGGFLEGVTKQNPYFYLALPKEVKAPEWPVLSMRLYSSEPDTDLRVFYSSPNGDWCLGYSNRKVKAGWNVYELNLDNLGWNGREASGPRATKWGGSSGIIGELRVDVGDKENREIKVDWVKLSNQPGNSLENTWNFKTNDDQGWGSPKGLECEVKNGLLCLNIQEADSGITNNDVDLDPLKAQTIEIKYKASGLPDETTGQIFYANDKHNFSGELYWRIPSLISDNNWHEIVLNGSKDFCGDFEDWLSGRIRSLRLDLVDQYPGKIQIEYIMVSPMKKLKSGAVSEIDVNSVKKYSFSFDSFTSLDGKGYQRSIVLPEGNFFIWVRAVDDLSGKTAIEGISFSGATKNNPQLGNTGKIDWFLVGETPGGNVSIVLSPVPTTALDSFLICDSSEPPKDKKAIIEPVEKSIVSVGTKENVTERGKAPYWTGYMLIHPSDVTEKPSNTGDVSHYFRRVFTVPDNFETAWAQISVDDYYRLYLNGEKIAENFTPNSWLEPALIDISPKLKKGRNVIAVESINAGGPGGLLFDLTINLRDLSHIKIVSDRNFVCSDSLESGWTEMNFNDGRWLEPKELSPSPAAPWTVSLPYSDKTDQVPTECVSCEYKKGISGGEEQVFKIKLKSQKPIAENEVLYLKFKTGDIIFTEMEFDLTKNICQKEDDNTFNVSVNTKPFSKYYPDMEIETIFGIYGRKIIMPDNMKGINFSYKNNLANLKNLTSMVKANDGFPQLYINGEIVYPMIENLLNNGDNGEHFRKSAETLEKGGFNIKTLEIGSYMNQNEWWLGPNEYNFIRIDQQINEIIETNPKILVLPVFWIAPPTWWQKDNMSEISVFNDGSYGSYYRSEATFSSKAWKKDTSEALKEFVRHMETSPYRAKIVGYWFIGGVSAEWQGWECHASHITGKLMDYSTAAVNDFRTFLKLKYPAKEQEFNETNIPTIAERLKSELGVFRDPKQAALAIDYDQYYSESISDAIVYFAGLIKNLVNREKIVGLYGGYTFEYADRAWAYHMSGHNAFRKVLDSKDIDFISGPPSYGVRAIGESGEWMWAFKSIQNAGKLVFVDDDTRTYLAGEEAQTINIPQTSAVLRRNFGRSLCRLCPICILPIVSGTEFNDPATIKDFRIIKRTGEYLNFKNTKRNAEIAVVVDEDSVKYLSFDKEQKPSGDMVKSYSWNGDVHYFEKPVNTLTGDLISYQRDRIAQIGAPYDYILLSDFLKKDYDYKLYIFLNCFQYDDKILNAVKKIQSKNVTMMWCYAPGFIHNLEANINNMKELTGIEFGIIKDKTSPLTDIGNFKNEFTAGNFDKTSYGEEYGFAPLFYVSDKKAETLGTYRETKKPSLAVKKVQKSNSIFCGSNKIPPDLLLSVAKAAGVHIYSDSLDFIDANEDILMFHAKQTGQKTIRLKRKSDVVDIFEGKVLFKDVDTFSFNIPSERTKVFFVGESDKFLEFMDYQKIGRDPLTGVNANQKED